MVDVDEQDLAAALSEGRDVLALVSALYPGVVFSLEDSADGALQLLWWEAPLSPLEVASLVGPARAHEGYAWVLSRPLVVFERRLSPVSVAASFLADWERHRASCAGCPDPHDDFSGLEACQEGWVGELLRSRSGCRDGLLEVPLVVLSPRLEVAAALMLEVSGAAFPPPAVDLSHFCPGPVAWVHRRLWDDLTNLARSPQSYLDRADLLLG